jgi:hypothetical protein
MLSARLDLKNRETAAILRCLGYICNVSIEEDRRSAGKTIITWYCQSAVAEASSLVSGDGMRIPELHKKASLYSVCKDALNNKSRLKRWFCGSVDWYQMTGQPVPTSLISPHAGDTISVPQSWIDFIACAISCGHNIRQYPSSGNAEVCIVSAGSSLKELHAAEIEIRKRHKDKSHVSHSIKIGNAEPEEHPFFYARETLAHLEACKLEEEISARNPVWLMKGMGGRSAAVSASLASEGRTEELLKQHLTGTL